jgi:hypothetical protein
LGVLLVCALPEPEAPEAVESEVVLLPTEHPQALLAQQIEEAVAAALAIQMLFLHQQGREATAAPASSLSAMQYDHEDTKQTNYTRLHLGAALR